VHCGLLIFTFIAIIPIPTCFGKAKKQAEAVFFVTIFVTIERRCLVKLQAIATATKSMKNRSLTFGYQPLITDVSSSTSSFFPQEKNTLL
jgi:hypothetical protein